VVIYVFGCVWCVCFRCFSVFVVCEVVFVAVLSARVVCYGWWLCVVLFSSSYLPSFAFPCFSR